MIPEAAVEAAARGIWHRGSFVSEGVLVEWDSAIADPRWSYGVTATRADARAALEAAAPHMLAGAWAAAYRAGIEDERKAEGAGRNFEPNRPNPYRPTP